jgi:hypothetical protein
LEPEMLLVWLFDRIVGCRIFVSRWSYWTDPAEIKSGFFRSISYTLDREAIFVKTQSIQYQTTIQEA